MISTMAINKDDSRTFLTEEHLLFKQSIREFLAKEAVPFYDQWEKEGGYLAHFGKRLEIMDFYVRGLMWNSVGKQQILDIQLCWEKNWKWLDQS